MEGSSHRRGGRLIFLWRKHALVPSAVTADGQPGASRPVRASSHQIRSSSLTKQTNKYFNKITEAEKMTVQVWASVHVNYSLLHHSLCVNSIRGGASLLSRAAKLHLIGWFQSKAGRKMIRVMKTSGLIRYLDAITTSTTTTTTASTTTAITTTEPKGRSTEGIPEA